MSNETYNERVWRQSKYTRQKPTCKGCGAMILWMKTDRGKNIPVDVLKFVVKDNANKLMTLLDVNGVIHRTPAKGVVGFRPHWVTCPKADEFRKGTSPVPSSFDSAQDDVTPPSQTHNLAPQGGE